MDPCSTPPFTNLGADHSPPTRTVMVLFVKNVASSLMVWLDAPWLAKDLRQC